MQPNENQGPRAGRAGWVYSVLPVSLATGPIGTLIQLYLVQLNGPSLGTIYAGLAVALFNGVSIPAAIFWGFVSDRLQARRAIIVGSYSAMALILFAFYFENSTSGTMLMYSIFSFSSAAAATPLSLLIMETTQKSRWAGTFARLSMVSSLGNVGGLVLSTVWAQSLPLILLSIPLGAFSLTSAVLALATIHGPVYTFEGETMAGRKPSFFARLLSLPLLFFSVPRASDFRRVFRGVRSSMTSYVPLFYMSTVFFYLSSGLFNTSFVPAMSTFSLSSGEVFAVILVATVVQALTFRFFGRYVEGRSLESTSLQGLLLRGVGYAMLGLSVLSVPNPLFVVPAIILYPLSSGVAYVLYYTSSNTMMFNTVQARNPGSALGVYSSVVGVATLAGSLVSGFISVFVGFHVTFISAGLLLFLAAGLVAKLPRADQRKIS